MIIESHAHYSHKRFDGAFRYLTGELTAREGQREDLLDRLRESSVVLSIEPAIDFESNRRTAALYRQHPDFIRLAVGVHPTRTHQAPWRQRRQLEVWAREPGVAAIGETGLDYHLPRKHRLTQLLWFRYQLGLARRLGLPLVLRHPHGGPGRPGHAAAQAASAARRGGPLLPGGLGHGPGLSGPGVSVWASAGRCCAGSRRPCGTRWPALPWTGCWWRPTAPMCCRTYPGRAAKNP